MNAPYRSKGNLPGRPPSRAARVGRILLGVLAVLMVLALAGGAWIWFAPCAIGPCAPVEEMARFQAEGSQLLDRDGEEIGTLATVNRRVVALDSLPPHLMQAFIAIEDRRFYQHGGIDLRRMGGAVRQTATAVAGAGGRVEGGSTITMQLARNLFPEELPYQERSARRKLMEARFARQIERTFSKDKILELYLNHIYLGSGTYGVDAAARTYFGKPAAEVNLAEAAVLAALPQAPSVLDPTRNREAAERRRNLVLREMAEAGFIAQADADAARAEPIRLASAAADENESDAPESSWFIERVRRELEERVGSHFYTAGLRVFTTMDRGTQLAAEQELNAQLDRIESGQFGNFAHPRFADDRERAQGDGTTEYLQGAVVILDAQTGAVRALVGGRDWADSRFDRAVQAQRQPGSAFKPFVYLAALERNLPAVHLLDDSPLRLELSGGRVWEPRNFGDEYGQMITMREALTRSKNTATVRLAQDVGMGTAVRTARDLGVRSDLPEFPSTALGAAEVRPIELVSAYAAFSNGGYQVEPFFVQRVEDRNGRVLWEAAPQRRQVVNPAAAFVLTSILQDVVERGTATAVRGAGFRGPAAGKTGTTNDNSDVWFVGYTPELVGGVWIGFDRPQRIIPRATGGQLAAPVWARVMSEAHNGRPMPEAWQPPSGVSRETVDRSSGAVVSSGCPPQGATYTEFFVGSPPLGHCPRDMRAPAVAGGDPVWGDEEALGTPGGALADRGIDWPELESRRAAGTSASPAPPAVNRSRPAAAAPAEREPEFVVEEIDESTLPGVPVRRDTANSNGNTGATPPAQPTPQPTPQPSPQQPPQPSPEPTPSPTPPDPGTEPDGEGETEGEPDEETG